MLQVTSSATSTDDGIICTVDIWLVVLMLLYAVLVVVVGSDDVVMVVLQVEMLLLQHKLAQKASDVIYVTIYATL